LTVPIKKFLSLILLPSVWGSGIRHKYTVLHVITSRSKDGEEVIKLTRSADTVRKSRYRNFLLDLQ